ncbi:MAG TPA: DUF4350 domain-containing protein [Bacteriovoracaceae bacterium]|nr:DUF4350 domain-containing protein [Bacteriovoracaceae bacterium]
MRAKLFPLWVIINLLLVIACLSLWVTASEYRTLNISLSVFTLCLSLILIFIKIEELKRFVKTKFFKNMMVHVVNVMLVAAILGMVNYLGNKNYKEIDITVEKRNSLVAQTLKVLEMVKAPLKISLFAQREQWTPILRLLKLYEAQNSNITIEAFDTDLRPDLVKSLGIVQNGTIILNYQDRQTQFVITDELSITNNLLKILRDRALILYMTTGHQELSCESTEAEGISVLCEQIKAQNYDLKTIDLSQSKEVPSDADAVLVLGPQIAFLDSEADQLSRFLKRGGSLFLALAPSFKKNLYRNLNVLAYDYGLTLGEDIVIDRLSTVQGAEATIPIISEYNHDHPITAGLNQRTIFPLSASVQVLEGQDTATLLAFTSKFPGSWAETDIKGVTEGRSDYQEGKDIPGPVGLLGIGESTETTTNSRLVLLGSSSFLINGYQTQSGNSTLFLNALSWMLSDEGIISFNRTATENEPVILSAIHIQMIFVLSIILVPVVFFGTAIFIYRRRRLL